MRFIDAQYGLLSMNDMRLRSREHIARFELSRLPPWGWWQPQRHYFQFAAARLHDAMSCHRHRTLPNTESRRAISSHLQHRHLYQRFHDASSLFPLDYMIEDRLHAHLMPDSLTTQSSTAIGRYRRHDYSTPREKCCHLRRCLIEADERRAVPTARLPPMLKITTQVLPSLIRVRAYLRNIEDISTF